MTIRVIQIGPGAGQLVEWQSKQKQTYHIWLVPTDQVPIIWFVFSDEQFWAANRRRAILDIKAMKRRDESFQQVGVPAPIPD